MPVTTEEIRKYFKFTPTEEQLEAVKRVIDFCTAADNKKVFILKGRAGTGKTSIVEVILKYFIENNKNKDKKINFVLLASTGRAAKVLSEKVRLNVETVHKHIYTFDDEESQKTGRLVFRLKSKLSLSNQSETIYIVDESSMLGNRRKEESYINFGSGQYLSDFITYTGKSKIIFVGDALQLPPVNEAVSIALSPHHLKEIFNIEAEEFVLTDVKRFERESGIYLNASFVADFIINNDFPYFYQPIYRSDVIEYDSIQEMVDEYVKLFTSEKDNPKKCIFITATNSLASRINKDIRKKLFLKETLINPNEFLIVTKNNYLYEIMNGESLKVIDIYPREEKLSHLDLTFIKAKLGIGIEPFYVTFEAYLIKESLLNNEASLSEEDEKKLQQNFFIRMASEGYRKDMLIEKLKKDPYFNALRVKYGYAVTCHKAQGGEWENVFIIFQGSIFSPNNLENPYRWIYTSITRSFKRLHILKHIGYNEFDPKNYRIGTFVRYNFSDEILVLNAYEWKSKNGKPMITLQTEDNNYLFLAENVLKPLPFFPAKAIIHCGSVVKWIKE